ncbi:MAG TPA: hypothetical protein VLG28_00385 [Acidimicrobiia bacterium]|nr:hypothetical protein [Acidimicrobiia bacterium]
MTAETLPPDAELALALRWASRMVGRSLVLDRPFPATSSIG